MKGRKLVVPSHNIIEAILKYFDRVVSEEDGKKSKYLPKYSNLYFIK